MHQPRVFFFLFIVFTIFCQQARCQEVNNEKRPKGSLYLSWGYNKDWYSKSDIHFASRSTDDFDFTIYDVKAHDLPRFNRLLDKEISIPQFIYRVGYTFARHPDMGIEIGFDHAKYIVNQDQIVHVKGKIHENYVDKDTILSRSFVRFEHTNGANFLMVSFVKRKKLTTSKNGSHEIFFHAKPGIGIVIPQSEVALFNVDKNNNYHIAGYIGGIDLGLRYEFRKHFLFETGFKGVFANYIDVLSVDDSKASHSFFCVEWLLSIGYQFAL